MIYLCVRNLFLQHLNIMIMKKEILKIIIKVLIYALGLIGSYLGISALTSCSASHHLEVSGSGIVITNDTTYVRHGGFLNTKNKNYVSYD